MRHRSGLRKLNRTSAQWFADYVAIATAWPCFAT